MSVQFPPSLLLFGMKNSCSRKTKLCPRSRGPSPADTTNWSDIPPAIAPLLCPSVWPNSLMDCQHLLSPVPLLPSSLKTLSDVALETTMPLEMLLSSNVHVHITKSSDQISILLLLGLSAAWNSCHLLPPWNTFYTRPHSSPEPLHIECCRAGSSDSSLIQSHGIKSHLLECY